MKNYCGIHLKLSHRINDINGLKSNPEWQIKILEENLSFLFNKNSSCGFFQMKSSSSGIVKSSPNVLTIGDKCQIPTLCDLKNETEGDEIIHDKPESVGNSQSKIAHPLQSNETIKPQTSENKITPTEPRAELPKVKRYTSLNTDVKLLECTKHRESDSNIDFFVEGEKIVTFVCGPSPAGKQTPRISDNKPDSNKSDGPGNTLSKSNLISQIASTTSNKSVEHNATNNYDVIWSQPDDNNKLLWHPAFTQQNCHSPSIKKLQPYSEDQISYSSNFQGPISHQNMETSLSRERTLFREMALRSCYTMENIISGTKPLPSFVHKEVKQTRDSIFSAISSKESSSNIVADNIMSVLDMFKSWVKLSSFFENKEFKSYLEISGLDQTVMNDFLQWQCVTRVFADKFVQMLNTIFPGQSGVCDPTGFRKGCCFSKSPTLLNDNNSDVCPQVQHNYSQKVSHGSGSIKYWKQHRLTSDEVQNIGMDRACSRSVCSIFSKPCSQNGPMPMDMLHGNTLLAKGNCEVNTSITTTNSQNKIYDEASLSLNNLSIGCPCPLKSSRLSLNSDDNTSRISPIGGVCNFKNDGISGGSVRGMLKVPAITFMNTALEGLNAPECVSAHHTHNSQPSGVLNLNQVSMKQSPVQYVDTEANENYVNVKINYMKPGSYNPPQKPANCQTVVNNNFPIEDLPVVGIPFVYNGTHPPSKASMVNGNLMKKDYTKHDVLVGSSLDCWQAALSSAEIFRNTLVVSKPADVLNLNLSDTTSIKTHFLLGDEPNQDSSSNEFKIDHENEYVNKNNFKKDSTSEIGPAEIETKLKTSNWTTKPFDGKYHNTVHSSSPGNMESGIFNLVSPKHETDISSFEDKSIKFDTSTYKFSTSPFSSGSDSLDFDITKANKALEPIHILQNPNFQCDIQGKNVAIPKLRKQGKNINDDCRTSFDRNPVVSIRKHKTIPKISITKEITFKLETILNCIWNTKVLSLVEEATITDRVSGKLNYTQLPLHL